MMNRFRDTFKKAASRFDTTLFFPPKEHNEKKNFKGQTVRKRDFNTGGPMPNTEELYARQRFSEDDEPQMKTRSVRLKIWWYGFLFAAWYAGVTLFIMYRMRGDDLDLLEKEAYRRQKVKKDFLED
jgi:hypothetical protein